MTTEPRHISQRYDLAKAAPRDDGDWWMVIDLFIGLPTVVDGVTMDKLELGEADDLVDLLNAQERQRLGTP